MEGRRRDWPQRRHRVAEAGLRPHYLSPSPAPSPPSPPALVPLVPLLPPPAAAGPPGLGARCGTPWRGQPAGPRMARSRAAPPRRGAGSGGPCGVGAGWRGALGQGVGSIWPLGIQAASRVPSSACGAPCRYARLLGHASRAAGAGLGVWHMIGVVSGRKSTAIAEPIRVDSPRSSALAIVHRWPWPTALSSMWQITSRDTTAMLSM